MGRKRERKEKQDHGLPMASMSAGDMIPMLIGRGVSITRSGEATVIPVGPAKLSIPDSVSATIESDGGDIVFDFTQGNPSIRLPFIGRIWPVVVEGMRLSGDTLTIELDGWKDYQIKVL